MFKWHKVLELTATGAFSSSVDHKRLLQPSSLPLTYWYSVTFEFHNCSATFITAPFRQRWRRAQQHFLGYVRVVGVLLFTACCSDLINYNKQGFFSFYIKLTMTNSNFTLWQITPPTGIINLCWYWSGASRGVRLFSVLGAGIQNLLLHCSGWTSHPVKPRMVSVGLCGRKC